MRPWDGIISEDEQRHAEQRVQTLTDDSIKKIDSLLEAKEQDMMTI